MNKAEQLLEVLSQIGEIYPELEKITVDNVDNPNYIIISTTSYLNQIAKEYGLSDLITEVDIDDHYNDLPSYNKKKTKLQ